MAATRPDFEVFKNSTGSLVAYTGFDAVLVQALRRDTSAKFGRTAAGRGYWVQDASSRLADNFRSLMADAAERAAAKAPVVGRAMSEREFDRVYNEGGEGYNPHRAI